jgi:hypothetical protein
MSAALQRDCCVGIRDAHPRLVPIAASNQPITNMDSSDNRTFPVIVREQEFPFNFQRHELFFGSLVDPSFVALSSRSAPARPLVVLSETSKRDQPDDQNVFYHDTSPLV